MSAAPLIVNGDRLLSRLTELRSIGETSSGGVTREAYSPLDVQARDLVAGWMAEAGLDCTIDPATNLVGRRSGSGDRWLASGSHLDTVVDAGWLDGAYGVVSAVEVATTLHEAGITFEHGLLVTAFANEEGARGTEGMIGSRAIVGTVTAEEIAATDDGDVVIGQRLDDAGGDRNDLSPARWDLPTLDAFVELHIEQGPVLDAAGTVIGVVRGIAGRQSIDLVVDGAPNHAGTTPMHLRQDALAAAAEVILAVEALAGDGAVRVATCGFAEVRPNVRNVVPGRVALNVEMRDEHVDRLDAATLAFEQCLAPIAERRGVSIESRRGQRVPPVLAAPGIMEVISDQAERSGLDWAVITSGAGHDAQILGDIVPMGMIFVPSLGGISHSPLEDSKPEHLVAGAQTLLDTLTALDRAPSMSTVDPAERWGFDPADGAYPRDLVGYGATPPDPHWPGGARVAVSFVLNVEEGGENNVLHGDPASETFLSEIVGATAFADRHMSMESLYEYGSRAGFWRVMRLFADHDVPLTVFGVARALEANPAATRAIVDAGHEIACHGLRWISYQDIDVDTERAHMAEAVRIITDLTGAAPVGWYTGRDSPNTRRLVVEHGGFLYDSDSYADDLPYWQSVDDTDHLVIPYTLDTNDMRFASPQGFNTGDHFFTYCRDAFDVLHAEGASSPKMLSIGLHSRVIGRPARFGALRRLIEHITSHDDVWICRRADIARHWIDTHPAPGTRATGDEA